jgi:hypothetical protein
MHAFCPTNKYEYDEILIWAPRNPRRTCCVCGCLSRLAICLVFPEKSLPGTCPSHVYIQTTFDLWSNINNGWNLGLQDVGNESFGQNNYIVVVFLHFSLKIDSDLLWQLIAWQPNILWPSTKSVRNVCKNELYVEPETAHFRQFLPNDMFILFNKINNWWYFEACDVVFASYFFNILAILIA